MKLYYFHVIDTSLKDVLSFRPGSVLKTAQLVSGLQIYCMIYLIMTMF